MKVEVKLTKKSNWQEVDVVGFYDPAKHQTVRLEGSAKKIKYYQMRMQDGRVYDKEIGDWVFTKPDTVNVVVTKVFDKLPYKSGSVKFIELVGVLERADDVVATIKECHRVLTERGILKTNLYLFPSIRAVNDPEFKNYFVDSTFLYFKKGSRYDLFANVNVNTRGDILEVTLKK